jgi:hypothetical protein
MRTRLEGVESVALVRRMMKSILRRKPRINRTKIDATTEADIRRYMREDGQDEPDLAGFKPSFGHLLTSAPLGPGDLPDGDCTPTREVDFTEAEACSPGPRRKKSRKILK